MIAATLFSGIGSPEVAMPHWDWRWCAETESFPSAVLAARHPDSINLGDVTDNEFVANASAIARPDVIVFGSPCQDFSVAGKRLGFARLKPRWFVFENVPGLLSNWSGAPQCPTEPGSRIEGVENSDWTAFLGTVDDIGYFGAWASLDAQFFGLAQRRDRLFFVGHSGDWRYPAAILFEPEGLCGDSPPRRQAQQEVAGAVGEDSKRSGQRVGRREAAAGHVVAGTITSAMGRRCGQPNNDNPADYLIAGTLGTRSASHLGGTKAEPDAVRRLTPRKCERLQGFPDDYTAITYRGKPAADGPRYKALGNSMAVPVMRWILGRIEAIERGAA